MPGGQGDKPFPGQPEDFSPGWVIQQMEKRKRFYLKGFLDQITQEAFPDDPEAAAKLFNQLRARIGWWTRSNAEFRRQWDILKEESRLGASMADTFPVEEPETLDFWMRDYARHYIKLLNHAKAATRLQAQHGTKVPKFSGIMKRLDPRSNCYCEAFGELMEKCDTWVRNQLEGNIFEAIEMARDQQDAKTLANISLESLSRLDRSKWGKHTQIEMSGQVSHNHHLMQQVQAKAQVAAGKVTDMFSGESVRQLPSGQAVTLDADFKVLEPEVVGGASN